MIILIIIIIVAYYMLKDNSSGSSYNSSSSNNYSSSSSSSYSRTQSSNSNSSNGYKKRSSSNGYSSNNRSSNYNKTEECKRPKQPKVKLYEAMKESTKTGKAVKYNYGTYVKDGEIYTKSGKKVRNKEAFFRYNENKYIRNHGYDSEHMENKRKHKKEVDEYLKWKKENKKKY